MTARPLLCAGLIAVIAGPGPARADTSTAGIVDFAFAPPSINVLTGDT